MIVEVFRSERSSVPGWYLKAPKIVQEDSEIFLTKLKNKFNGVHVGFDISEEEKKFLIAREKSINKTFDKFGLLHEGIVKFLNKFYISSSESVDRARKIIGNENFGERNVKRSKQNQKVYRMLKAVVMSRSDFSTGFLSDSLQEIEYTISTLNSHEIQNFKRSFLEIFVTNNSIKPEKLIEEIVGRHIQNIENRNRKIELDQESVLKEPERVCKKTWKINKKEFALHELKNDAELDYEGIMGDNCVSGDVWKTQIKVNKNGEQVTRIFSLGWIFEGGEEKPIFENTDFYRSGFSFPEQILEEMISEIFDDPDDTEELKHISYTKKDLVFKSFDELFAKLEEVIKIHMSNYYARRWVEDFKKIETRWRNILEMKTKRLPLFTIEYNVVQKKIRQIKMRGNEEPNDHTYGIKYRKTLVEAIAEIHKKYGVESIEEMEGLEGNDLRFAILKSGEIVWDRDKVPLHILKDNLIYPNTPLYIS